MSSTGQKSDGIGVVDTTSLWAAARHLDKRSAPSLAERENFIALLHNIILYDELRTDFDVLDREDSTYSGLVKIMISRLEGAISVEKIPSTISDFEIMEVILPVFFAKLQSASERYYIDRDYYPGIIFNLLDVTRNVDDDWQHQRHRHYSFHVFMDKFRNELDLLRANKSVKIPNLDEHEVQSALRALLIVARTIRYATHSRFLQNQEGKASAFCAAPRRIHLLRDYVDHELFEITGANSSVPHDLFSRLGLPSSGYDFSGLVTKPLSLSDLGRVISNLNPNDAIERVLKIRVTDAAQELRRLWAERLWSTGPHALEGYSQVVRDVTVEGDLIQVIGVPAGSEPLQSIATSRSRNARSAGKQVLAALGEQQPSRTRRS